MKLTENEVVTILMDYLQNEGYKIDSYCLGQTHGKDIVAEKDNQKLIVEAKGAMASNQSPTKTRKQFDSSQIKAHFGRALVKVLEEKYSEPSSVVAIAHPEDEYIRKLIGHLSPFLKSLGIRHYWVSRNGKVVEE